MGKKELAPQQARSRESLSRLVKATAQVLETHGIEGATIPRIAKLAGLSPGSVYRRFKDKDALIETVILHIMKQHNQRVEQQVASGVTKNIPLARLAQQSFRGMLTVYRTNAGFFRAARRFAEMRPRSAFFRELDELEVRGFNQAVEIILQTREEIKHPRPRQAVTLGLLMVVSAVREIAFSDSKNWQAMFPQDDDDLSRELARAFLAHLGVSQ